MTVPRFFPRSYATQLRRIAIGIALGVLAPSVVFAQDVITTFAGGGPTDGTAATAAGIPGPAGVVSDSAGNIYFGSTAGLIYKADNSGQLHLVAGSNISPFVDGVPAVNASLVQPTGLAVDAAGNLFVAESGTSRIRRIDASTGIITTVAGNANYSIAFGGDGGPAISAELNFPTGVAVDAAGNIFIADTINQRIRRVDAATGFITTVAGNGIAGFSGDGISATSAELNYPSGVAVDSLGTLWIADYSNGRLRRVDASTGIITTVATGNLVNVFVDGGGSPYFTSQYASTVQRVDPNTLVVTTVAGNGTSGFGGDGAAALSASLNLTQFSGLFVDASGNILVADTGNFRVREIFATSGVITTVIGTGTPGDGGPAATASLDFPPDVTVDAAGNLFIADQNNGRVRRVDATTGLIATVAGGAAGFGSTGDGGPATAASLGGPDGVALDGSGNLFIGDIGNVRRVDAFSHVITTVAGNDNFNLGYTGDGGLATSATLSCCSLQVALDAAGDLFIADENNNVVRRVDATTHIISTVAGTGAGGFNGDGIPATAASLNFPTAIAIDASGNLLIADTNNQRVRRVDTITGLIATIAGNGSFGFPGSNGDGGSATSAALNNPDGVAFDSLGNLFIGEAGGDVRRVDVVTGRISTIAGNGCCFGGDGGPAMNASLNEVRGIAVDPSGGLLIADAGNNRVRRVSPFPFASLLSTSVSFGAQAVGSVSSAQTVTLENTGSIALNISSVTMTGDFAQTNTCGVSVPSGGSCTFSVTFSPSTGGSRNGAITIHDNAPGGAQVIGLTGTGSLSAPTLTALPTTVVGSGTNIALSGTGAPGASIALFDGGNNVGVIGSVDGTGHWSALRSFIVGAHTLTATQSIGGVTSGQSFMVTVHVRPQSPSINNPGSAAPGNVTLTGSGFYGGGQNPPTGSIVTIFENNAPVTTVPAVIQVGSNGQWSATISLAVGSHTLTASQMLAGETSDLSNAFTLVVFGAPTLTVPLPNVVSGNNIVINGTGVPAANITLFDGTNNTGGVGSVASNGTWSTSRNFSIGTHSLTATQSLNNQTSGASTPAVTVNVRPQAPGINGPNSVTSATGSVTLSGFGFFSTQNPVGGATVNISENGSSIGSAPVTQSSGGGGQWTATIQFTYATHQLSLTQTFNGQTSDATPFTLTVSAPLTAPVITAPVNNVTVTVGTSLTVSGNGQSLAFVNVFDGASQVAFGVPVGSDGTWQTSVNLIAGTHTLTATQSSGGQTSSASTPVFPVHVKPSTPSISSPNTLNVASLPANGTVYGFGYFANGQNPVAATVTIFEGESTLGTAVVGSNGQWSASVSLLSIGQHTLTAQQAVGIETSATSSPFTVNVNISNVAAPTLQASPTDNVAPGDSVTINGTGIAGASLTVFDGALFLQSGITVDGTGHWSIAPRTFTVGTHPLTASQSSIGQTSPLSATATVHVLPPAPSIIGPSSVNAFSSPSFLTLYGSGFYNAPQSPSGATVTIFDGGNAIGSASVVPGGTWSSGIQLAFGQHNLTVSQSLSGETSVLSSPAFVVTVTQSNLQSPSITAPSNNFVAVAGANVTVSGNGQSGATVSLFDGGTLLQGGIPVSSGTWSVIQQFAYGSHPLTASQTNNGQTSSLSQTVTVNVPPPAPVITSAVVSGNSVTVMGTGTSNAVVSFIDGSNNIGGGATVIDDGTQNGTGNWSAVLNLSVGPHQLTAKQAVGVLTSAASSPATTVDVKPSAPSISGPSSVTGTPSTGVTFTLNGFGAVGQGAPVVNIYENGSSIANPLVQVNGQWSASLTLAYGSHSLTATQTILGETSAMSPAFVVTVSAPLAPPTLQVSPTTVVAGTNFTASGTGLPGAQVFIFDGANQNPVAGGVLVVSDGAGGGTWSTPLGLIVGAHSLTARQTTGGAPSGSSAPVTVHVQPPAPNINGPSSVTTASLPVNVTLAGSGFYGGAQTPPTGATVTISEGGTSLGTALVQTDSSWTATISLGSLGQHTLTVTQSLAGETSAQTTFNVTVNGVVTSLVAPNPPDVAFVGDSLIMTATLSRTSDPAGPLANEPVVFTLTAPGGVVTTKTATTDVSGNVSVSFPPYTTSGQFMVTAAFAGDGALQAAPSPAAGVVMVYQKTSLAMASQNGFAGSAINVTATLTNVPSGTPLAGQPVRFDFFGVIPSIPSIPSQIATTTAAGVASVSVTFPNAGSYTATASFQNPAGFFADHTGGFPIIPETATATVTVAFAATSLSALNVPASGLVGNSLTVSSTLSRVTGLVGALANEPVVFTLTGPGSVAIVQTGTTDASGNASASFSPQVAGQYTVAAAFAGDGGSQTSPPPPPVSVAVYQRASLALQSASGTAGSPMTLTATLTTVPGGAALVGQQVMFSFGGVIPSQTGIVTDVNGVATVHVNFPNAGTFTANASFLNGGGFFVDHTGAVPPVAETASASVTVAKATTVLSVPNPPPVDFVDNSLTMTATLSRISAPSGPLAGEPVVFTLTAPGGGVTTMTATTDVNGNVSVSFPPYTTSGQFMVTAAFAGDGALVASASPAAGVVTVYQKTLLLLNSANGTAGSALTVSASLSGVPINTPVAGQPVRFDFFGVIPSIPSQIATTSADGVASVSVTFPNAGSYTATASFQNPAGFFTDQAGSFPPVPTTASDVVTVSSAATSLSALNVPASGLVGNSLTVSSTLSRVTGLVGALANEPVVFTFTGPTGPGSAVVQTGTTDVNGVASVNFPLTMSGQYTVAAAFAGDGGSQASPPPPPVSVAVYQRASLALQSASGTAGSLMTLTATLTTVPGGAALAGQQVIFSFGGVIPSQTATTTTAGVASVSVTFPNGGTFTANASFLNGAGFFVDHTGAVPPVAETATASVTMTAALTSLSTLNVLATSFVGDSLPVVATLMRVDAPAGALANEPVVFTLTPHAGPATSVTGTTNAAGIASVNFSLTAVGPYTITTTFAGDGGLQTSSAAMQLGTVYQRTFLQANGANGAAGSAVTVSAGLHTAPAGAPVAGQTVSFDFGGAIPGATGVTDANGIASVSVVFPNVGVFKATASFVNLAAYFVDVNGDAIAYTSNAQVTVVDTTPPTIDPHGTVTAPATSAAGASVSYTAPATHDNVDGIGTASCSPAAGSLFPIGTTQVLCDAADAAGNHATQTSFNVVVTDVAPLVQTSGNQALPSTGSTGAQVTFSVSATSYGNPIAVSCLPFPSGAEFPVGVTTESCTAADVFGGVGTASFTLTVGPNVSLPNTATVSEGSALTTGGTFTDPNPGATATVNYGDGSPTQALPITPAFALNHVYADPGPYTVTIAIADAQLGNTSAQMAVTVNNVAPAVSVGSATITTMEGTAFTSSGSFIDPGVDDGPWVVSVDYGDGTPLQSPAVTLTSDPGGVKGSFPLGHPYADYNTYNVTVTVTDKDGGTSSATFAVTATDVKPTVVISSVSATSLNEGQSLTGAGTFHDPGTNEGWTATVDYGDGSGVQTLALTVPGTDTGSFTLNHPYASAGAFTVTVTVFDNDHMSGSATVNITVASSVSRFVALSRDMTWLRENSTVVLGDVGATDRRHPGHTGDTSPDDGDRDDVTMRVGVGATMQQSTSRVAGDTVLLLNKASIYNVIDNFLIQNKNATVGGTKTNTMNVPYTNFPAFVTGTPGTAAVTVAKNKTTTLAPGSYGTVHVSNGATLILSGGVYNMLSLDLDGSATVIFHAATEIHITTELDTLSKAQLILDKNVPGLKASQMVIYVAGADSVCVHDDPDDDGDDAGPAAVHIGSQSTVQANIYALNGTVWLKSKTQATGAFLGVHVRIGVNATITLDSAFK